MLLEFTRLAVGLFIAIFHVRIADFIFQHEELFAASARQRGLPLPMPPKAETLLAGLTLTHRDELRRLAPLLRQILKQL